MTTARHRRPKRGLYGAEFHAVMSRYIHSLKINESCRQEISLSGDLDLLNNFSSGEMGLT